MSGCDLNQLCEEVSIELEKAEEWMTANRLSLNVQKTSFMVFTHRPIKREDLVIEIGGTRVQNVRAAKFLGVTVDDRLSYNQHVSELSKKLSCSIGLMYRVYNCVPRFVISTLYFRLFYLHLIYAMTVWGGGGTSNCRKIAIIQKRALKLFTNSENVSRPLNYDKLFTLHLMRKFQSIVHNNSSSYFLFKVVNQIPNHEHFRFSRHQKLNIPRHHKSMSENQF